jgi:phosphohistidine phosphatase
VTLAVPTALELYLVRHAIAALRGPDYPDDTQRPLTPDGIDRWRRSAAGLRELGVTIDLVIASPLVRAHETAEILAAALKPKPRLVTSEVLAPGRKPAEALALIAKYAAAARGASKLALVGHEPDLGELASRLLGAKGLVEFKKGAVCRIDVDRAMPGGPGVLRWFLPPRMLRGLA